MAWFLPIISTIGQIAAKKAAEKHAADQAKKAQKEAEAAAERQAAAARAEADRQARIARIQEIKQMTADTIGDVKAKEWTDFYDFSLKNTDNPDAVKTRSDEAIAAFKEKTKKDVTIMGNSGPSKLTSMDYTPMGLIQAQDIVTAVRQEALNHPPVSRKSENNAIDAKSIMILGAFGIIVVALLARR